ncbi:MAG: hypothetical protein NTV94_11005 [Planctomycetota bacterium]|nr:hypothetical protein [Planctomycetota bacterium]
MNAIIASDIAAEHGCELLPLDAEPIAAFLWMQGACMSEAGSVSPFPARTVIALRILECSQGSLSHVRFVTERESGRAICLWTCAADTDDFSALDAAVRRDISLIGETIKTLQKAHVVSRTVQVCTDACTFYLDDLDSDSADHLDLEKSAA